MLSNYTTSTYEIVDGVLRAKDGATATLETPSAHYVRHCLMRVETRIQSPFARDNALTHVATRQKSTGLLAECVAPP